MTRFAFPPARQLAALACGLGFCATAAASMLPLANAVRIAGGNSHSCALTKTGGVLCWGGNESGQLGNGTIAASFIAASVPSLTSGVLAIAAGGDHNCVLTNAGGVKCWGANSRGQLGIGAQVDSAVPVDVPGLTSNVMAISAGDASTCALTGGGAVKCWGANDRGQVGDGTKAMAVTPTDVAGMGSGSIAIATGGGHACALIADGGAKCWGRNDRGQLGNGRFADSSTPVDVAPFERRMVRIIAGGANTCALAEDGGGWCWGSRESSGIESESDLTEPTYLGWDIVADLDIGDGHTCGIAQDRPVCWGANSEGQAGDGTRLPIDRTNLFDLYGATSIAVGDVHSCAARQGGVACWGSNASGQLGNGGARFNLEPVVVLTNEPGSSSVDGSLAIEYYHPGLDHYFITANPLEVAGLDAQVYPAVLGGQWERTGQSFRVQPAPSTGWAPVCRFFSTFGVKSSHFYTADAVECAGLSSVWPNWLFENIAFHMALPDANGSCPPGTIYVYRLYNKGLGGAPSHRLTTSFSLRETMIAQRGWISEGSGHNGVAMCAPI